jgi:hypothetical protein
MGAKNSKKNISQDNLSISSVFEKPLSSNSDKNQDLPKINIIDDNFKEIRDEIKLPIENEFTESPEIIFEPKQELKIKNFFEDNDNDIYDDNDDYLNKFFPEDLFNMKRSKTYAPKPLILETPRLHSKASENLYMSPIQLSKKSFGIVPKFNQKPNKIYLDFPKDKIDCKSCNDKEELLEEYFLYYSETEKTTPNLEDLQDLLNCRKKMIKFRNSINYKHYHEYENILNCEDLFEDIQENEGNYHHNSKKKSFFKKHIKSQLNKDKNIVHNKRLYTEPEIVIDIDYGKNNDSEDEKEDEKEENKKDENEENKEDEKEEEKEDGLFILGVIERAVKERKSTKSVVVK